MALKVEGHGECVVVVLDFRDASDDSVAAWGAMIDC